MELIIDIPDITYDSIMARDWKNAGWLFSEELKAIHDGTPLPKGHGRLIDADRLWDSYHDLGYDFYEAFDLAETIIEADTESEI